VNTIQLLRSYTYNLKELYKIENRLHNLDEKWCNGDIEESEFSKKETEYMRKAQEMAAIYNLKAYHQQDPRGGALYLIDDSMNDSNYTNGICIC
jgi:benzoyl-CoA reductase/2-hydroxyglutaryl-CoA dehydratase subunit BcrC/BadD/HgdB